MPYRNKLFITPTLATVIGCFVLLTAAAILIIQAATSNALLRQLGSELVDLGLDSAETALVEQLHAVTEAGSYTAIAWSQRQAGFEDPEPLLAYLYGALAPLEQVSFMILVDEDGRGVEVERGNDDATFQGGEIDLGRDAPVLLPVARKTSQSGRPVWDDPVYVPQRSQTYFILAQPLFRNGTFQGSLLIGLSLTRMSEITQRISTDEITVFLMKQGTDEIVAHPRLPEKFDELGPGRELLHVDQVPDEFLAGLNHMPLVKNSGLGLRMDLDLREGHDESGEKRFVIVEQRNVNMEGLPVRIGVHFPAEFLEQAFEQMTTAIAAGVTLLMLSMIGAILLARRIARPVKRASAAANKVAGLELETVSPLPPSVIRELDDLSTGFNSMLGGLKAFNRYVPRTLVQKLLSEGRVEAPPEEREVAVLFSDIVGFTSISEGMSASETAAFVNHHLSLLGAQITRYGGTIDKYVGDSIMAFWGAPDDLDNPAEAAARAALGMARAIHEDNLKRAASGAPPVRIRIGVHMGPLVVGDIGAPERVNYTVIGDTVNAASRLESLGKEIDADAEVIVLASNEIAARLGSDIQRTSIGLHAVKGRTEPIEVVRLSA